MEASLTVHDFMRVAINNGALALRAPMHGITRVKGLTSIVLYREGAYQIEMAIMEPNHRLPEHSHPNVDSIEMLLSGTVLFVVDGRAISDHRAARANGISPYFMRACPVPAACPHWAEAGTAGAVFLSFQKWNNGDARHAIGLDWSGAPNDPSHLEQINAI